MPWKRNVESSRGGYIIYEKVDTVFHLPRWSSQKLSSQSIRVVAICQEAVVSVQPCLVQHTK